MAVCCWAAQHGTRLPGDFVECGVNTGILSLAVCKYVGFNDLDKSFYLFDTFAGIPVAQMSEDEKSDRLISNTKSVGVEILTLPTGQGLLVKP